MNAVYFQFIRKIIEENNRLRHEYLFYLLILSVYSRMMFNNSRFRTELSASEAIGSRCYSNIRLEYLLIVDIKLFAWTYNILHIYWCLQFVQDGLFKAELNEFLTRELAEDGYSGVEVRVTPTRTEIIILATRTQNVLGEKGRRIRELTSVVQKRYNFPEGTVEVCWHKIKNPVMMLGVQWSWDRRWCFVPLQLL